MSRYCKFDGPFFTGLKLATLVLRMLIVRRVFNGSTGAKSSIEESFKLKYFNALMTGHFPAGGTIVRAASSVCKEGTCRTLWKSREFPCEISMRGSELWPSKGFILQASISETSLGRGRVQTWTLARSSSFKRLAHPIVLAGIFLSVSFFRRGSCSKNRSESALS